MRLPARSVTFIFLVLESPDDLSESSESSESSSSLLLALLAVAFLPLALGLLSEAGFWLALGVALAAFPPLPLLPPLAGAGAGLASFAATGAGSGGGGKC